MPTPRFRPAESMMETKVRSNCHPTPHKGDIHMRTNAKIYIAAVLCLGIGALLASIAADTRLPDPGRFIHCLVLAILASTFKIRLPRMQSSISLNFVLFIIGIGALTLSETLV